MGCLGPTPKGQLQGRLNLSRCRPDTDGLHLKGKIVLVDGSVLHIKEYIDAKYKIERVSYAYQYQDRDGELIFRYDNAVHRPALGYRKHKHTQRMGS